MLSGCTATGRPFCHCTMQSSAPTRAWGEVDSLRLEEIAPPAPAADEVLIDMRARAVIGISVFDHDVAPLDVPEAT